MNFQRIDPSGVSNVFREISNRWMLITAGDGKGFNSMTASWGGLGHIWNRDVAVALVRHSRYTYGFMEKAPLFTLSFYDEAHRPALNMFGTKSGRDFDKLAASGFTPAVRDGGAVFYEEASLALVCRKLYHTDLVPENFIDAGVIKDHYADNDFHRVYFAEIVDCLERRA